MKAKGYIPIKDWDNDRSGVLVEKVYVGSKAAFQARDVKFKCRFIECDLKKFVPEENLANFLEHNFGGTVAKMEGRELHYGFGDKIDDLMFFFVMKTK